MVSGSLCPLISFLDVSYSVSFAVRGQRPRRGVSASKDSSKMGRPQKQLRGPQRELRVPKNQQGGPQSQLEIEEEKEEEGEGG